MERLCTRLFRRTAVHQDLIYKLMEEATAETEHKGWCDTELATNKQTRERRNFKSKFEGDRHRSLHTHGQWLQSEL